MILPRRFTRGRLSVILDPFCSIDLSEYVFDSPRIATNRYLACIDWSPDGMSCLVGTIIDRRFFIQYVPSGGTPFDFRAAQANPIFGNCWTDQPGGNQGRRNMIGCQFSPNGNRVISSHYNFFGFGELAEWTLPSPYFCTYEPDPDDYLLAGQPVLTRNINTPGNRMTNFRVAPNGIDMLGVIGGTTDNLLGGWRMPDPWNILSIVYDGDTGVVSPQAGFGAALFVPDDGTCFYRRTTALIRQYILDGDPWKPVLNDGPPNQTKDLTSEFSTAIATLYINRNWMHVTPGTITPNYMYQYKRV